MENNDEIMVSVSCLAYNHEKYIKRCLDGFVMQKTSFKFEVIVHDDASTDGTADIIREYADKYPDIIKPILQTENKYSKKIPITKTFVYPMMRGKYVAFCEGDDFWIDENKLQLQYEAMESHPECNFCTHYVNKQDVATSSVIDTFPSKNCGFVTGILDKSKVIELSMNTFLFQLSSYFIRKSELDTYLYNPPEFVQLMPTGDTAYMIYFSINGGVLFIDKTMSNYNYGTEGSWTKQVTENKAKLIALYKRYINAFTSLKDNYLKEPQYIQMAENRIIEDEWRIIKAENNYYKMLNRRYKAIFNKLPFKTKIKIVCKSLKQIIIGIFSKKER